MRIRKLPTRQPVVDRGPFHPDPREARCVRHVRDGAHVWLDIGRPEGPVCKYCRRRFGRRYKARGSRA